MKELRDGWTFGSSVEDWEALGEFADRFHDGVVRECYLVHDDYVDDEGRLVYGEGATVALVVQSQSPEVAAIELRFHDVSTFAFRREQEVDPGEVSAAADGRLTFRFLACEIDARSFRWRPLGRGAWGPDHFLCPGPGDGEPSEGSRSSSESTRMSGGPTLETE